MITENKIFTVEYNDNDECVEIHIDKNGALELLDILNQCIKSSQNDHFHLLAPSWGGQELTDTMQNIDDSIKPISHLKIIYWASGNN